MLRRIAERVFPTMTEPLRSRQDMRRLIADDAAWDALFEAPSVRSDRADVHVRRDARDGPTDGLIGTFASADDPRLRQNRCFLYHVIGNGTGRWDVPVGGMGALSSALAVAAQTAGASS